MRKLLCVICVSYIHNPFIDKEKGSLDFILESNAKSNIVFPAVSMDSDMAWIDLLTAVKLMLKKNPDDRLTADELLKMILFKDIDNNNDKDYSIHTEEYSISPTNSIVPYGFKAKKSKFTQNRFTEGKETSTSSDESEQNFRYQKSLFMRQHKPPV